MLVYAPGDLSISEMKVYSPVLVYDHLNHGMARLVVGMDANLKLEFVSLSSKSSIPLSKNKKKDTENPGTDPN